jgi:3-deoxy-D-manno-octulosonate 8-phosphate phosphatase (KDO 8-P phosphatase)
MHLSELDATLFDRVRLIRLMIFDVDGVLTDGRIIYHDDGTESKEFDVQDGHGIKLLQRAGLEVALITGRECRAVTHRAAGLGISRVYQGAKNKLEAYAAIRADTGYRDEEIGFMGDDLIDIPVLRRVGLAIAVPNAVRHVLPYVHYVTRAGGGRGACREVCEMLLQVQERWQEVTRRYFEEGVA